MWACEYVVIVFLRQFRGVLTTGLIFFVNDFGFEL